LNVLGVVGRAGSGKTTVLVAVIPLLRAAGLSVSAIRQTLGGFDMDRPGKDSDRHRRAGAHEVLVASSRRWALLHEAAREEDHLPSLLARMAPVDFVLVEGMRSRLYPKLEVFRPILLKPPLWNQEPQVVAVASDAIPDIGKRTLLPLNDLKTIAAWIRTRVVTNA
jgi:molybdopterin-guanine dinucleotide biosynthesis protein B